MLRVGNVLPRVCLAVHISLPDDSFNILKKLPRIFNSIKSRKCIC